MKLMSFIFTSTVFPSISIQAKSIIAHARQFKLSYIELKLIDITKFLWVKDSWLEEASHNNGEDVNLLS